MTSTAEIIQVGLGERSYPILIGPGLLESAGARIAEMLPGRPVVVLTDETVAGLHLITLETAFAHAGIKRLATIVLPPGEGAKTLDTFAATAERILEVGIDRKTLLVALGGGVVGDLAGFLAATLLRGIDFVQIPTTLLAQVDSSVGGKTGIDSRYGKNLIGAFHQPRLVIADTGVLATLPMRERRAGYAEIVKYGFIGDAAFFAWLEEHGQAVLDGVTDAQVHAVAASCRAKAAIVAEDEREAGRRALLNLGHTFGHALEVESGFGEGLIHGEAVAIGMNLAFALAVRLGICPETDWRRARDHLVRHGLPVLPPAGLTFRSASLIASMRTDKKAEGGRLTFVLPRRIGDAFVAKDVEEGVVAAILDAALLA